MVQLRALFFALLLSCALRGSSASGRRLAGLFDWFGEDQEQPVAATDPSYVRPIQTYNPMTATTAYALQYVLSGQSGKVPNQTVQLTNGAVQLFSPWEGDLVLVFSTSSGAKAEAATGGKRVPFLQPFVYTAEGPAPVVDAFSSLLSPTGATKGEGPLADAVGAVSGGRELHRIVCTGADPGGAELAALCGPWAALRYPTANADVITFGDSWSPAYNPPFSWAFQQLVTLHYLWPFDLAAIQPNATADPLLAMAEAVNPFINAETVAQAVAVPSLPSWVPKAYEGWDPEDALGELGPAVNLPEEYQLPESECPPILCKTREALALSCLGFGKDADYGTDVFEDMPHIMMKDPETDGDAVVAWNESSATLYLLFKYTEESEDWLIDAQATQSEDFTTAIAPFSQAPPGDRLSDVVPDVEVHSGFWRQFSSLAVTPVEEGAKSCLLGVPMSALLDAVCNLTGGTTPLRVVSSGFSLGAALSELGGVWAAQLWPGADVTVANQGGPIVGDENFVILAQATFGRAYKYVYRLDEVPSIPPLPDYHQSRSSIWIVEDADGNTNVMLQNRPNLEIWETNWNDHTCDYWDVPDSPTNETIVGYVPQLLNATRVVVPAWVFNATVAK